VYVCITRVAGAKHGWDEGDPNETREMYVLANKKNLQTPSLALFLEFLQKNGKTKKIQGHLSFFPLPYFRTTTFPQSVQTSNDGI